MGSNTEKKLWNNVQNLNKHEAKKLRDTINLCYRKVEKAITKMGSKRIIHILEAPIIFSMTVQ